MEEVPGPCVEADRMIGSRARAVPVPLLLLALAEDPDAWKWRLRRTSNGRRRAASRVGSTDGFASNLHLRMDSPPNVEDLNSSRRVLSFLVSFKGASTFTFTHAYDCYSDLYTHAFYLTSQWSALYYFFLFVHARFRFD